MLNQYIQLCTFWDPIPSSQIVQEKCWYCFTLYNLWHIVYPQNIFHTPRMLCFSVCLFICLSDCLSALECGNEVRCCCMNGSMYLCDCSIRRLCLSDCLFICLSVCLSALLVALSWTFTIDVSVDKEELVNFCSHLPLDVDPVIFMHISTLRDSSFSMVYVFWKEVTDLIFVQILSLVYLLTS